MSVGDRFDPALFRGLDGLRLHSSRRFEGRIPGERPSPRYGSSLEFVDFRPYAPGDDHRYVDWNVYRRLDRLVVKLFREDRDLCLHLLVDVSASMGVGEPSSKLDQGLRAGAALAYVALVNHERVALGLLGEGDQRVLAPRRGRRQIFPLLELLEGVRAGGRVRLGEALHRYAWSVPSVGVAVLVSDLLEPEPSFVAGVRALLARGFEVRVLHVLAREETSPALDGDLRLLDLEAPAAASAREVTVDRAARERYAENLARFLAGSEAACRQLGAPYLRLEGEPLSAPQLLERLRSGRFLA